MSGSLAERLAEIPAPPTPASRPAAAAADPGARARALFARPLIIGASVSSGYRAESPARRLARSFGTDGAVVSLASPGASGANQVRGLTDERLAAASVVVGVDLFFWDAQRDCAAGLAGVDELFQRVEKRRTPLVIANVPSLHAPFGLGPKDACRDRLNTKIEKACREDAACVLLDLNGLYAKAAKDGSVELDGRKVPVRELFSDGLHLSDAGSRLMARAILDAIAAPRK
jgi:hypothetical protein